MLLSAVVALHPAGEASRPAFLGKAVHALLLRLVSDADTELAAALHDQSETKPFTVSEPMALRTRGAAGGSPPAYECFLRVTSYDRALSHLLAEKVLPAVPRIIALDDRAFSVQGVFLNNGDHPLSSQTSFEELAERHLLAPPGPPRRVTLHFASPTTFRSADKNVPLPLPGLVFGGLADRWNAYSPVTVPPDVRRYAEEHVAIPQCNVRTRTVQIAGGKQVGFVGSCSYVALTDDGYWPRIISLLAAFALYSGVGYKTTMGFGQTFAARLAAPAHGRTRERCDRPATHDR